MSGFNAKAARAKRPCPIWVDSFQRDTQHLEADEIGAYFLLLMAMWTRETCDFPDDDNRLARVCRVSPRLWKSRIGPVIRTFLLTDGQAVYQKRLREEASYVERQVKGQSDRKVGEKSDKPLKNIESGSSADNSTDEPPNHPSQQPNNPTYGGGGSACATPLSMKDRIIVAIGLPPDSPKGLGSEADMLEARRWFADLKLSGEEVLSIIAETMAAKPDGPPNRFSYFTKAMQRYAAAKAAAATPLAPAPAAPGDPARPRPGDPPKPDVGAIFRKIRAEREAPVDR